MTTTQHTENHPYWIKSERPAREDSVLPFVLERNAAETPDRKQFEFESGETWTCQQTLDKVRSTAALFAEQGIAVGDFVLAWLPSGPDMIRSWFGLNYLGAVFVPLNVDYRGSILLHAIKESTAKVMILHPQLLERLDIVDELPLARILCVGDIPNPEQPLARHKVPVYSTNLETSLQPLAKPAPVNQWDLQMIIFTSGTTGPSKGVMCPYLHMWSTGQATYGYMTPDDVMLVELPTFHVGGVSPVIAGLSNRTGVAVFQGFKTDQYWQRIKATGATCTSGLIGSMAAFLEKAPAQDDERNHSLKMLTLMLNQPALNAAKRYGFDYISGFNMTELSGPLISELNSPIIGTLGKPRTGCECRVVDSHDLEVGTNEIGELIVRMDQPWTVNMGYLNRPDATAEAWRNGWFHTGDLVRKDANGNFFFVDRKKDAVRRSGENVSSIEVEAEVASHESVAESAVVGITSERGDQEILVAVVLKPGYEFDPKALAEYLIPRMAHFMVPRYIRHMQVLPRTPTNKVKKVEIRDQGITPDTWDREAAGMRLRRTKLD